MFVLSTGNINAIGPHIPIQWKLPNNPNMSADIYISKSTLSDINNLYFCASRIQ
ncbi:hypothetical protein T190130A13A_10228 [Tenacibaculum sp. 190130A14a]|uniref:Uncharacterized protein n=1 Tax=Tenacibaculum polynesiense TaxID=3137857 RepID=A0ABP1EX41_9FLAO